MTRRAAALAWVLACCACSLPVAAGAPPPAATDAGASERLEDATFERRVFRHILVGKIRYPSQRLTWVLYRSATRARLEVFCQAGQRDPDTGITLNGKENDETYWLPPVYARYAGTPVSGSPLTFRLELEVAPAAGSQCSGAPPAVTLACRREKIQVLGAGAVLIPGTRRADETITPPRWQPAGHQPVTALRCQISRDDSVVWWQPYAQALQWPLAFVLAGDAMPGVEWVDENSDMIVQRGAYRRMLAPP